MSAPDRLADLQRLAKRVLVLETARCQWCSTWHVPSVYCPQCGGGEPAAAVVD